MLKPIYSNDTSDDSSLNDEGYITPHKTNTKGNSFMNIIEKNVDAPDWLRLAIGKNYNDADNIEYLHNYTKDSHLIVCGDRHNLFSEHKEDRNRAKIPLNNSEVKNNLFKWSEKPDLQKVDIKDILEQVKGGKLLGFHPQSFNLLVLDVDTGDYKDVIKEAGQPIIALSTPSGGKHLVYYYDEGLPVIKKQKLQDFIPSVTGDVIESCGFVVLYELTNFTKGLKSSKRFNKVNPELLGRLTGEAFKDNDCPFESGSSGKGHIPEKASFPLTEGPRKFASAVEGSRNDTGNEMIWRDALYGLLDDNQYQKYIRAAEKNGMPISEITALLTNSARDGRLQREQHKQKFGIYPQHTSHKTETYNLEFDRTNPLEIERVIREVMPQARYEVRKDQATWKFEGQKEWQEYDDNTALKVKKQLADLGYYTPGKNKNHIAAISLEEINNELSQRFADNRYDSISEYFTSLRGKWDGTPRVSKVMNDLFLCERNDLLDVKTKMFFCAIINRAFNPGVKLDLMFYIIGRQSTGKTQFFSQLFPKHLQKDAVSSNLSIKMDTQRFLESLGGSVCAIFDEAFSNKTSERERLKSLVTATKHRVRRPYARVPETILPSYVLCATSNDMTPLTNDVSGNRRYVTFHCDPLNKLTTDNGFKCKKYLDKHRDQIWAEALYLLENNNIKFHFTGDMYKKMSQEQEKFRQRDSKYEDIVEQAIEEGVLKNKTRFHILMLAANILTQKPGAKEMLDMTALRTGLFQGDTLTSLNLTTTGSAFDIECLKTALKHSGYIIKKARPCHGNGKTQWCCVKEEGVENE